MINELQHLLYVGAVFFCFGINGDLYYVLEKYKEYIGHAAKMCVKSGVSNICYAAWDKNLPALLGVIFENLRFCGMLKTS